ncbi:hypothetical protein [Azospirillum agricola]|uniref:hypothetical protein n=1 Tax=Azospirillum agricola TaxID=1720247 RepID=UPI000A0F0AFD|nr:hypothetical protein [Azospirillum agricola]SMH60607.1 hypothetical protein SAMN02982994_5632 [Azospirillum lipoferum]
MTDDATTDDRQSPRIQRLTDALHAITLEAGSARSALCEHELVIRLDNILALAQAALRDGTA